MRAARVRLRNAVIFITPSAFTNFVLLDDGGDVEVLVNDVPASQPDPEAGAQPLQGAHEGGGGKARVSGNLYSVYGISYRPEKLLSKEHFYSQLLS